MIQKFTIVFGSLLFLSISYGDEARTNKATTKAVQPPFANYWDAEAWEKGSTDNFWRSTSEVSRKIAPKRDVSSSKESKVWQRSK